MSGGIVRWNDDEAFSRCRMRPMPGPTWESLLALPEGTEVLVLFVLPMTGGAIRGMQFVMDERNHRAVENMRDDESTDLPTYAAYILPDITVPEPEDFINADNHPRKDADNG